MTVDAEQPIEAAPRDSSEVTAEHVDVLIVGAGLSGICAAHHMAETCPWASYTILEARNHLGGTWDLFRYPGIRSDSDMHTLGFPFRPWTQDSSIADGASILGYLEDTAREEGIDSHIRYGHRVLCAEWSSADARWLVTVERRSAELTEVVQMTCSFLLSASGYYRYDRGHLPDFEGMADFAGRVVHPQAWPEDLDLHGARVVVIGSGATAVTLVPAIATEAACVTMLQRSPTYMASLPTAPRHVAVIRRLLPRRAAGTFLRWLNALRASAVFAMSRRRPDLVKRALRARLERELPAGFDIDKHFTPDYDPWDQRLCVVADGDLFAALRSGRASIVTDEIDTFTTSGIRLRSGEELPADVVVTATGLELLFMGGIELVVDGRRVEPSERLAYRNMLLEDVPNAAMVVGYSNSSWTLRADLTCSWIARLLRHMHDAGMRQVTPVNHEVGLSTEPLMGLSSGYVLRAIDRFPRQGSSLPWRSPQSYLRDYLDLGRGELDLDSLEFSNPTHTDGSTPTPGDPTFGGRVAAVTGAGSGIGRALAEELASRGCHLALADIDDEGLLETAARCEGKGVKVSTSVLDVSDREGVAAWADAAVAEHGGVHMVFNNAGVALGATVEGMSHADLDWLMGINFGGVVNGTKAFLPHMTAAGRGHVVNVSSVFGLLAIPTQSAYNSSKFAVRGFTEALRMELALADSGVSCTVVHPGGIRTNIARNARVDPSAAAVGGEPSQRAERFERVARTTPQEAALKILEAVEHDRPRVLIGPDAAAIDLLARLPIGLQQRLVLAAARRRS